MRQNKPSQQLSQQLSRIAVAVALLASSSAYADVPSRPYGHNDFGTVGLLQTPTARMNEQSEFTINYSDTQEYRRMAVTLQLYDWFEATARYTDIRYRLYSQDPGFSGDQTLKDKGLDAKIRLWQESQWLPQVAVGFQDIGGTGIFAGEYVVANKRLGDFDFSAGLGWGYLGQRDMIKNPFCVIADRMCQRPTGTSGTGGQVDFDKWFRGPTSVFGGVNYYTPLDGLSLQLEYDGNDYQNDRAGRPIVVDSPWNFGATYQYNDNLGLRLGYQRGNTLSFGFNLSFNFNKAYQVKIEAPKQPVQAQPAYSSLNEIDLAKLSQELSREAGLYTQGIGVDDPEQPEVITFYGTNTRYMNSEQGAERAAHLLSNILPESIKRYEFATIADGLAVSQTNVNAELLKREARGEIMPLQEVPLITQSNVRRGTTAVFERKISDAPFSWGVSPYLSQSYGSPEAFFIYQLMLNARANYRLNEHWTLNTNVGVNLLNNYDLLKFELDAYESPLPRVRSGVRSYIADTDVWVDSLYSNYTHQFSDNSYAQFTAGYFERMFAGVGGEWLYKPLASNWAVGVDLNYVRQRDPDSLLGIDDYGTLTGHASVYWNTPYLDDTLLIARAGKFLAKDTGVHLELAHTFDSGVIAGAYAAFTNVSAEDFGEGSFNKGFYLSIPFDLFFVSHSRRRAAIGWVPIQRDGGQLLSRPRQLYYSTSSRN